MLNNSINNSSWKKVTLLRLLNCANSLCCTVCDVVWLLVWASPTPYEIQHGIYCCLMWMSSNWIFLIPALIQSLSSTAFVPLFLYCFIFQFVSKGLRETTLHRKTSFTSKSSSKENAPYEGVLLVFFIFPFLFVFKVALPEFLIGCWIFVINPFHCPMINFNI